MRLRVALFTDSFHETNGVGTFCREYAAYARGLGLPFLCVHGGRETAFSETGPTQELQLRRGPLSFKVDAGVFCDPLLSRHVAQAVDRLRAFRPDLVHITGPGDVSIVGLWAANRVGVPVIASWHTNLHEYAHRRLQASLPFLPGALRAQVSRGAEHGALWALSRFYRIVHFIAAPNQEMVNLLAQRTGRPAFLMAHGVNTEVFAPRHRDRTDSPFVVGYVGRLSPEKNVRALVGLERELIAAGERDFRFLVVGDGREITWLRANLRTAEFTGALRGQALSAAFANMDAFVFPSLTDTFGLVILEAMSSGVPVIVAPEAGIRSGVLDGIDGFHSHDFTASVRSLMHSGVTRNLLGAAGRVNAVNRSWLGVFDDLHRIYAEGLDAQQTRQRMPTPKFDRRRRHERPPPSHGVRKV